MNSSPINSKLISNINNSNYNLRINGSIVKYVLGFIILIIIVILLYVYHPFGLFSKYVGPTVFISIALAMFLLIMVIYNQYLSTHPNATDVPQYFTWNFLMVIVSFFVSAGL